jgi:hypothetical protein
MPPEMVALHGFGVAAQRTEDMREHNRLSYTYPSWSPDPPLASTAMSTTTGSSGPVFLRSSEKHTPSLKSTWSHFSDSEKLFVAADREGREHLVHRCSWRHRRPEISCRVHRQRPRYNELLSAIE